MLKKAIFYKIIYNYFHTLSTWRPVIRSQCRRLTPKIVNKISSITSSVETINTGEIISESQFQYTVRYGDIM